ncbi:uncharacterized protein LOC143025706 [Oratosquilla oratoria]|uniref:uncharacterized protein LOC143025706 n=1 Tax=Oratosquilla oratoria TaxID=337810 RepID=UPI003F775CC9
MCRVMTWLPAHPAVDHSASRSCHVQYKLSRDLEVHIQHLSVSSIMSPVQIAFACCLLGVALARPETLSSLGHPHPAPQGSYGPPQHSFAPQPSYTPPQPSYSPPQPSYSAPEPQPHNFEYAVQDYEGSDFGHSENSDGQVVTGSYFVNLPDGRRQTVTYTADDYAGYVAQVQYEGEAQYPAYQPAQTYHAPAPVHQPVQTYSAPAPVHRPAQTYNAPAPIHSAPAPVTIVHAPQGNYGTPHF